MGKMERWIILGHASAKGVAKKIAKTATQIRRYSPKLPQKEIFSRALSLQSWQWQIPDKIVKRITYKSKSLTDLTVKVIHFLGGPSAYAQAWAEKSVKLTLKLQRRGWDHLAIENELRIHNLQN